MATGPPLARARPRSPSLPEFVERLREACVPVTRPERVEQLLGSWRPALDSLRPFVAFDPARYVRRRLHREDGFELVLLCWDPSQATPVHDHDGQAGWISVLEGSLVVQEYERLGGPANLACIQGTTPSPVPLQAGRRVTLQAGASVTEAAAPESIHRVGAVSGRALSLHVYAGPLDTFLVFDVDLGTARRVHP